MKTEGPPLLLQAVSSLETARDSAEVRFKSAAFVRVSHGLLFQLLSETLCLNFRRWLRLNPTWNRPKHLLPASNATTSDWLLTEKDFCHRHHRCGGRMRITLGRAFGVTILLIHFNIFVSCGSTIDFIYFTSSQLNSKNQTILRFKSSERI